MFSDFLIHKLGILYLRHCWGIIACISASFDVSPSSSLGWSPKSAAGLFSHINSQCEYTMVSVIYGQDYMTFLNSVVKWDPYLNVTILTTALNPNLDTGFSNYW